jgi:hypothetical protein
VNHSGGI